jgi:hypothetical protein
MWDEKSVIPLNRRGHTMVYDPKTNALFLYGGVFGYSRVLSDCYQITIDKTTFTATCKEIKKRALTQYYPEGRAWHTATQIRRCIYYVGGMKDLHVFAGEVVSTHSRFLSTTLTQEAGPKLS